MKPRTLNHNILLTVIGLTVFSQFIYLYVSVRSFQNSYLETVRDNLQTVGMSLKEDLDFILGKNIPIQRLFGLQKLLQNILTDAPTLQAIAIHDNDGRWLYYCDRDTFLQGGDRLLQNDSNAVLGDIHGKETDTGPVHLFEKIALNFKLSFELFGPEKTVIGSTVLAIDQNHIRKEVRNIALDSLTIIIISILTIIDFVFFIVAYTITLPIFNTAKDITAAQNLGFTDYPIRRTGIDFTDRLLIRFERFRTHLKQDLLQLNVIESFLHKSQEWQTPVFPTVQQKLADLQNVLNRFHNPAFKSQAPFLSGAPALIRPAIFLFVFAEALANSFMPLYAMELYRPLWNLSKDVVLGLPISSFMLLTSLGLPFAGALSDAIGRKQAFITGASITCMGLVLCATANGILALIGFRAVVGLGFGITYISVQGYIIDTSSEAGRAEGMAIFLSALYGGSLCGTVIGALIADRIGYRSLFFFGAFISLTSLVFVLFFISNHPSKQLNPRTGHGIKQLFINTFSALPSPRETLRLFSDRNFSAIVLFQAIPSKIVLIGLVFFAAPLMLKALGNSQSDIGRYVTGYSLVMILFSQPVSKWCDRKSRTTDFVFWGSIISGLAMLPLFFFENALMVALSIVMIGLAHTLVVSNQDKLASQLPSVQSIGIGPGLGLYRQCERMGNVVAPLLLAWLITACGYGRALGIVGIYVILSGLLFRVLYRPQTTPEQGRP
jgi:MFS family permease